MPKPGSFPGEVEVQQLRIQSDTEKPDTALAATTESNGTTKRMSCGQEVAE